MCLTGSYLPCHCVHVSKNFPRWGGFFFLFFVRWILHHIGYRILGFISPDVFSLQQTWLILFLTLATYSPHLSHSLSLSLSLSTHTRTHTHIPHTVTETHINTGDCCEVKDGLMSNIFLWTPRYGHTSEK